MFPKTSLQVRTGDLAKEKVWPQTGSAAWVHGPLAVDEAVSWCGVTKDIVQDLGKPWAEPLVGHAHHARRRTFRVNATTARTKKSNYRPVSLGHWRQIGQALHVPLLMGSSKSRRDDGSRSAPTLFGCLWRNRLFHTPCMQVRKRIAPNTDEALNILVLIHRISFQTKKTWFRHGFCGTIRVFWKKIIASKK